jgi:hypothetical protein
LPAITFYNTKILAIAEAHGRTTGDMYSTFFCLYLTGTRARHGVVAVPESWLCSNSPNICLITTTATTTTRSTSTTTMTTATATKTTTTPTTTTTTTTTSTSTTVIHSQ